MLARRLRAKGSRVATHRLMVPRGFRRENERRHDRVKGALGDLRDLRSDRIYSTSGLAPLTASDRRNSRCIRGTIVSIALLDLPRSALPYLTPLTVQFASKRVFGVSRSIITPTKPSQSGSAFLIASEIADCKWARETDVLSWSNLFF
jgi:hypothetical protein